MDAFFHWLSLASTSATFLIIGLVGVLLLIFSFVLDGIFEALDFGDGPLSLTTISAFGAIFGFVGYASIGAGASTGVASAIGAGVGVLGGLGAWKLSQFLQSSNSTSSIQSEGLAGRTAVVTLTIPGGDKLGEVALVSNGQRHNFSARSELPVATGKKVLVTATITDSSLMVEEIKTDLNK